jgi:hypothetical protein
MRCETLTITNDAQNDYGPVSRNSPPAFQDAFRKKTKKRPQKSPLSRFKNTRGRFARGFLTKRPLGSLKYMKSSYFTIQSYEMTSYLSDNLELLGCCGAIIALTGAAF